MKTAATETRKNCLVKGGVEKAKSALLFLNLNRISRISILALDGGKTAKPVQVMVALAGGLSV